MFGGYSAEEITFGDISTGASNDLQVASEMARKLVTKYGMSEKFGPLTFGKTQELIFLGKEITTEKNYSDAIAYEIDKEVEKLIQRSYQAAKKIIQKKKGVLEFIAKTLIEKETIEKDEFEEIIKKFKIKKEEIS